MFQGEVVSIHLAPSSGEPMLTVPEVHAVAGKGLEGDRYARDTGSLGANDVKQVSLVSAESLESLAREYGIAIRSEHSRRNLITRGVDLSGLVHRRFRVGGAVLRGVRSCQPCLHLEDLLGPLGRKVLLEEQSGLYAEILEDGFIRPGDPIREI